MTRRCTALAAMATLWMLSASLSGCPAGQPRSEGDRPGARSPGTPSPTPGVPLPTASPTPASRDIALRVWNETQGTCSECLGGTYIKWNVGGVDDQYPDPVYTNPWTKDLGQADPGECITLQVVTGTIDSNMTVLVQILENGQVVNSGAAEGPSAAGNAAYCL